MPSIDALAADEPDDRRPDAPGRPEVRRAARALVDGLVAGQAQRARSFAATVVAVADLVETMSAPGGPTAPLAETGGSTSTGSTGTGTSPSGAGAGGTGPRAGSPAATRARRRARARTVRAYATGDPVEATTAEIALALHLTTYAAARLVDDALALTTDLPTTLAALTHGVTDEARARVVVAGTAHLSSTTARWVDAHLTAQDLAELTTAELRARVAHLTALADPQELASRTREGTCARAVRLTPLPDGMAQLCATGPALDLAGVFDALTGRARDRTGSRGRADPHAGLVTGLDPLTAAATPSTALPDTRGMDARRFDALVDSLTSTVTGTEGPTHLGRCHGPQVVVAMTSLLGLDDEPAQLTGVGPVPVHHLRGQLTEHPYRRAFTDPVTGRLVALDGHLVPPTTSPTSRGRGSRETTSPVVLPLLRQHLGLTDDDQDPLAQDPFTQHSYHRDPGTDEHAAGPSAGAAPEDSTRTGPAPRATTRHPPDRPPEDAASEDPAPEQPVPPSPGPARVAPAPPPAAADPRRGMPARPRRDCPVAADGGGAYVPTTATERHVRTRQTRCGHPGCRVPATRCDLDHVRSHATGGPTCPCNMTPLCRRHHLAKHHFGWHLEHTGDDPHDTRLTWTSPLGQTAITRPEPVLPLPVDGLPLEDLPRSPTGEPATPGGHSAEETTYPAHDSAANHTTWTRETTTRHERDLRRRVARHEEEQGEPEQHHEHRRPSSWHDDPPPF